MSASIEHIDKLDLQSLAAQLLYWQRKAEKKSNQVKDSFKKLREYYAVRELDTLTIRTPRYRDKEHKVEIKVVYQYSEKGRQVFEDVMEDLEIASSGMYEFVFDAYERLYQMKPQSEIKTTEESVVKDNEFEQQPGVIPEKKVTTESQNTIAKIFSVFSGQKKIGPLDDISSPYRRASDIIDELQNIPVLLERVNAFHENAIIDVDANGLTLGISYQISRRIIEINFLKTYVRPKILKLINANNMLNLKNEQKVISGVLTNSLQFKEKHRPPDYFLPQPPA